MITDRGDSAVGPGVSVVGPAKVRVVEGTSRPTVEVVFDVDGFTLCRTRLDGGASAWHHHGNRTAYGVVLAGRGRIEWGPDGADGHDVGPDEFFVLPPAVVHREVVTGSGPLVALVGFASGTGVGSGTDPRSGSGTDESDDGALVVDADPPVAGEDLTPPPGLRVAGTDDLVPAGWLANVTRLMPFPDAAVQQVRGHAAGDVESNWHHHGDNHVFGHVLAGEGYMQWGADPDERELVGQGEWFHLEPGVVHRDVNPSDADQHYLLWLTGSEPRTVTVEGPTDGDG
jgi:uncharacterized RmlC-like cupin family protein